MYGCKTIWVSVSNDTRVSEKRMRQTMDKADTPKDKEIYSKGCEGDTTKHDDASVSVSAAADAAVDAASPAAVVGCDEWARLLIVRS